MRSATKFLIVCSVIAADSAVALAQSSARRDDPNRLICRRTPETGSLAQSRRQCFTRAEWDRIAESQRNGAQRMIGELTTRPAGE